MNKKLLQSAIEKTFVEMKGVEEYYIFWDLKDGNLTLRSAVVAFKTTTVAEARIKHVDLPTSNFVIRDPKKLINVFDICGDEIEVKIDDRKYGAKLIVKDSSFESEFTLCDPNAIRNKPMIIDEPISYDFTMHINQDFTEKFLKAKKANNESSIVSVEVKNRLAKFELGDLDSFSNKIKFSVEEDGMFDMNKCHFSSDVIREILNDNKKLNGRIDVHEEILMKISFQEMVGNRELDLSYFTAALDII